MLFSIQYYIAQCILVGFHISFKHFVSNFDNSCLFILKENSYYTYLFTYFISHCIFTIMNHQRISTFWFCTSVLLSIHRNKLKRIFEILWVLFEKISVFYSELDLYPGFGWPWGMLGIFFVNVIFKTLQKKSFGQKSAILPELKKKIVVNLYLGKFG